ncbi:peroxisomal membrane protein pex14 [Malassezia japonica]|uniref:Peroxisomal membrane protein PEX14 n=1 Tax=Malassezia japonica TaxID=223818 RepID=A0AAF0EXR8_9BASI|nr:peroxisomal membrane protein pex14 [Malassezia japonica]WFD39123.1 peroxisomal membrane protein pex14 [Malassezia japonica]
MADSNAPAPPARSDVSTPARTEMIQSAVSFLADPKVQSSPISQRVSFLESKGLTPQEVDLALAQASRPQSLGSAPQYASPYPMMPAYPPGQQYRRDWRDWFIMAVVSGTIGYGIFGLARRYLYPHMQPPNQTVLEAERDELAAKYDEVALHLEELDQTTEAIRQGLDEHQTAIEKSVVGVNEMVEHIRTREESRDKDVEKMKAEVEEMREEFSSLLNRARKGQIEALTDLQGEMKSLRTLMNSRGGLAGSSSSTAPAANASEGDSAPAPARPAAKGIPSWQLQEEE